MEGMEAVAADVDFAGSVEVAGADRRDRIGFGWKVSAVDFVAGKADTVVVVEAGGHTPES